MRKPYTIKRKDGTPITVPEQRRSATGASNAEINRELTILKRMFTLALQAGKLFHRPHVPMLEERNNNIVSSGDLRTAAEQLHGLTGTKKGQSGTLSAAAESERSQIASDG